MSLPFLYIEHADTALAVLELDEANSRHAISVLRMQEGQELHLTDGRGTLLTAFIESPHKKHCGVRITTSRYTPPPLHQTGIAISPVKNPVRFEWFLEKATEIGITHIIPLICSRTEKQHYRHSRMQNVLVSALLQSRQCRLPELQEALPFDALGQQERFQQKFIAYCGPANKKKLDYSLMNPGLNQLVLIGPEGDFTPSEFDQALQLDYTPVSLGQNRLRTETAGLVAAVVLAGAGASS